MVLDRSWPAATITITLHGVATVLADVPFVVAENVVYAYGGGGTVQASMPVAVELEENTKLIRYYSNPDDTQAEVWEVARAGCGCSG